MILRPKSLTDLSRSLAQLHTSRQKIGACDLGHLARVLEYHPEDMTVTVEGGITLANLQETLAAKGQWLPIDPPFPGQLPVHRLLSENLSGPRRFGHGTIREHLIGLKAALADGRVIKSGGKVVKNVAGYDLAKLFIGERGTLGIVVEATFKVLPKPQAELVLATSCSSAGTAWELARTILASKLRPAVLDAHNLIDPAQPRGSCLLVLAFAGTAEEVKWQQQHAETLARWAKAKLSYDETFWQAGLFEPDRISILPSNLAQALDQTAADQWLARVGNGLIYYRGGTKPAQRDLPVELMRRVKDLFDPHHVWPELSL